MAILSKSNETILLALAAVAAGYAFLKVKQGADFVGAAVSNGVDAGVDFVKEDLNPTSEYNFVNQTIGGAVNETVKSYTGDNLGGTIFCFLNSHAPPCNVELFNYAFDNNLPYYAKDGKTRNVETMRLHSAYLDSIAGLQL